MDIVQIFNWFCKEQKIVHLIREMFYTISPRVANFQDSEIVYVPVTYTQYIENSAVQNGIGEILHQFIKSYFYKIGWNKYNELHDKYKLGNIINKWHYFVTHNINVKNINVGDTIEYDVPRWDFLGVDKVKGKVVSINLENFFITLFDENSNRNINIYGNQMKANKINLEYYIKRNKKEYYGANR